MQRPWVPFSELQKKKKKGFMSLLASQLKQLVGVDFDPFI
jgi:hypothetical protein